MLDWIDISSDNSEYFLKISRPKNIVYKNSLEIAHSTIAEIIKKYPPPYTLCISGGVDSQAMLYAWHTSGVPYQTCSVRYNNDLNDHDLITLRQFSERENIKINYIDFDVLAFLENEYIEYVHRYRCGSPHFCTYMKFSEIIEEGTVLFSGTPVDPTRLLSNLFGTNELSLYRYAKLKQRHMIGYFFLETKDIAWSLNKPETFTEISKGCINRAKIELLWHSGYPVIPQWDKITGFEKIKDYYDINMKDRVTAKDRLARGFNGSTRVFDLLLRNKYERMYPDKYNITWNYYE